MRTKFIVIVLHMLSTWFMVGMIWTIHVVHYPLFAFVGSDTYEAFQAQHVNLIGRLLLVPWLVEGLTALALVFVLSGGKRKLAIAGAALILSKAQRGLNCQALGRHELFDQIRWRDRRALALR